MASLKRFGLLKSPRVRSSCPALLTLTLSLAVPFATAQLTAPPRPAAAPAVVAQNGVRWQDLTPAQRTALQPLERDWAGIESSHKQKWLELSARVPLMSAAERARIQDRMADWTRLSPRERGQARLNFEEAKQLPAADRQARWEAYQALPPEQKRELAERAVPPLGNAGDATRGRAGRGEAEPGRLPERFKAKSNIVPNPAFAAPPRPVAATVMQAQPGATTTLISKRPSPPPHQQTGLPKIAATPGFVDKATLLPQRGPQGAATRPAAVPDQPSDRRK